MRGLRPSTFPPATGQQDKPRARGTLLRLGVPQCAALAVHAAYARATYNHTLTFVTRLNPEQHNYLAALNVEQLTGLLTRTVVDQNRATGGKLAGGYRPVQVAAVAELADTLTVAQILPGARSASRGEHVIVPDVTLHPTGRTPWVSTTIPDVGTFAFRYPVGVSDPTRCVLRFARFGPARWYVYVTEGMSAAAAIRGRFLEPLTAVWSSRPGARQVMARQVVV